MSYKVQKPCKICGKMYTPCSDCETDDKVFHWRKVACSYECGQKYLAKVLAERTPSNHSEPITDKAGANHNSDTARVKDYKRDVKQINYKTSRKIVKRENKQESEQIG